MGWVVAVSESERAQGQLSAETAEAGYSALIGDGALLLRGVFTPEAVDAMYREYYAQYGGIGEIEMGVRAEQPAPDLVYWVGESRYEITTRMNGAFGDPNVFANPLLRSFLAPLLGDLMRPALEATDPEPEAMTVEPFLRGDCVLLDYRTLHAGLPNQTNVVRPIAYLV